MPLGQGITGDDGHVASNELLGPVADAIREHAMGAVQILADQGSTPSSNRASFSAGGRPARKARTNLKQKLALSNALKNMVEKHKIQGEEISESQLDK